MHLNTEKVKKISFTVFGSNEIHSKVYGLVDIEFEVSCRCWNGAFRMANTRWFSVGCYRLKSYCTYL